LKIIRRRALVAAAPPPFDQNVTDLQGEDTWEREAVLRGRAERGKMARRHAARATIGRISMAGKFLKTLAAGVAATAIAFGAAAVMSPADAAAVWHGGGGWHGGGWHGGGWHGGGWHGGGWGWRGGYRTGWYGGGWGYPYGWGWGATGLAVGLAAAPYYYPNYAGCWQVRSVYSTSGAYLGNRRVNVCR
jgi:hypothetical protein